MTIHSKVAWKHTRNSMGPLSNPNKDYAKAGKDQLDKGKARRKLEDLKDQKDLENYIKGVLDE